MFVMTAKLSKPRLIAAGVLILAVVILVVALVSGGGDGSADAPDGATNDARLAYLAGFGWSVNGTPKQTQQVRIPKSADDRVFSRYNALQKSQGFDLTALGVLREGDKLLIFPEGTRVREGDVSHPHVGAVTFACRTDAPIVPVFLTRKKRFWAPLTLVFGEAYHPQFEGRRPSSDELEHLTQEMMDKCYALGGMQCPSA